MPSRVQSLDMAAGDEMRELVYIAGGELSRDLGNLAITPPNPPFQSMPICRFTRDSAWRTRGQQDYFFRRESVAAAVPVMPSGGRGVKARAHQLGLVGALGRQEALAQSQS
jgi:hypothetical protein